MPFLFIVSRVARMLFGPGIVKGLEHLPRTGPYIIAPNHQSFLDPVLVCSALPYRLFPQLFVVGAAEYFETPLMRRLARALNLIPVDPDANLVTAMKASAFGLQHGKILMLFPEGERSIDGTVKRFKKGAPILARHVGVPVVPAAIRGAFELWPRKRPFNWKAMRPWSRHEVRVAFGSPLRFDPADDYRESANRLREAVDTIWNDLGPA
jgi:long-chain acyl-CoA synthetase